MGTLTFTEYLIRATVSLKNLISSSVRVETVLYYFFVFSFASLKILLKYGGGYGTLFTEAQIP